MRRNQACRGVAAAVLFASAWARRRIKIRPEFRAQFEGFAFVAKPGVHRLACERIVKFRLDLRHSLGKSRALEKESSVEVCYEFGKTFGNQQISESFRVGLLDIEVAVIAIE